MQENLDPIVYYQKFKAFQLTSRRKGNIRILVVEMNDPEIFKEQVFNIAPQMRTYNDAAARQYWLPYITYATYPLLRSPVLNTDKFGLRHSLMGDGSLVTLNDRPE